MVLSVQILAVSLIATHGALAFQPLKGTSTRAGIVDLSYKNRTDADLQSILTSPGTHSSPGTSEVVEKQGMDKTMPGAFKNYNWKHGDDVTDDMLDPKPSFFEDGTPYYQLNPTLDMLKEWTQEYIDAVDLSGGITRVSVGVQELMAKEFVLCSPGIGPINKQDFIGLMKFYNDSGFDLASAVPDLTVTYDGWHQDPHEPWRIWAVARYSGTHTGTAVVPNSGLKLTPRNDGGRRAHFSSGPEMHSFLWTADKKILWQTMGFVGDSYTGSNQGHGALDGLLVSMGLPHLYLEAISPVRTMQSWVSQFREEENSRSRSRYSHLPQWWHERKSYDLNIHK